MTTRYEEIRIRGKDTLVPAEEICGRTVIVTGRFLRRAQVMDEELVEGELIADPAPFVATLRRSQLRADLLTFAERPPQLTPRYDYRVEWDNWAVIPLSTYADWWEKRLPQEARKNARRAAKRGVIVRTVPFDSELVRGIQRIYNETPVRQGRKFWHYGKDVDAVTRINETYKARSAFIGAFFEDELIGFVKVVFANGVGALMQILSMNAHYDKRPMNALLAHTVQECIERRCSMLVYGQYTYGSKSDSSLAEFKRRTGFEQLNFPRYYVPLTLKGRVAIAAGLHLGVQNLLPGPAAKVLLSSRALYHRLRTRRAAALSAES